MSRIVDQHGGTIDKFIGDAIIVYFGDRDSGGVKEDVMACLKMAIAMQEKVKSLRAEWTDLGLERTLDLRIGINTGYCTVGNFGSSDRMDYTIIGSTVNLAARLESAADVGHPAVKRDLLARAHLGQRQRFSKPIKTRRVQGLRE